MTVGPDGRAPAPPRLDELFESAVRAHPDRVAVVCGERRLTYRQLDGCSAHLARRLQERGIGPGALVGVSVERGVHLLSALLGVVRSGAAYLPLDPEHPEARRADVLRSSGAALLVADEADGRPGGPPVLAVEPATRCTAAACRPRPVVLTPADAVYTIYTSGSTGRPKGVVVPHRALANFLDSMAGSPGMPAGSALVAVTTVSFDIAALELFLPLAAGGRVVLATPEQTLEPRLLAELIRTSGARTLQATPSTWRMLKQIGWEPPRGFTILCGGEKLPPDLAGWFGSTKARAWDLYGPTETTIWSSVALLDERGAVHTWRPVANTTFHLMDDALTPVEPGGVGEVYIGGDGLASGYLDQPALTAERFVPDPYGDGTLLYRTGDLGRWSSGGALEILGRTDHQVKIRGHRVETGEVDAAAAAIPGVEVAVTHPKPDPVGGHRLVLYVVPSGGASAPTADGLRAELARSLPDYMVPSRVVILSELPLTANGKVDRARLPDPADPSGSAPEEPRTESERFLQAVWADLLGARHVRPDDDFFDLGGHSLAAASLVARIRERRGVDIPVGALLRTPVLAAQAELLDRAAPYQDDAMAEPPRPDPDRGLPLTSPQQRILFAELVRTGEATYTTSAAYHVSGPLDLDAFEAAVQAVAARHDALRARFPAPGGDAVQHIADRVRIPVTVTTVPDASPGELVKLLQAEARRPFDLAEGPPMRVALACTPTRGALVLFCWHHIVFDGWSLGVFLDDLATSYRAARAGGAPELPPAPVRYADVVERYRRRADSPDIARQLRYWTERLVNLPDLCTLPADRPRPPVQSASGALVTTTLDAASAQRFRDLCRGGHLTLYTGLLTAFTALLSAYTGSSDVIVGTPAAARADSDAESVIGLFANTLGLRIDTEGAPTFAELAGRVREAVYGALEHQDVPFERIVDAIGPERNLGHNPVFQVLFNHEARETGRLRLPGARTHALPVDGGGSRYDLAVTVRDEEHGPLDLEVEYATDLYDRDTAERLLNQYADLIAGTAAAGEDVDLSAAITARDTERAQLAGWNTTGRAAAPDTVHALVEHQARSAPRRVAVRHGPHHLTYGELDGRADRLARVLAAAGAGPGTVIGVCVPNDLELPTALLAVLKSGAAYLPLDPLYPKDRLASLLDQARPPLVVAAPGTSALVPDGPWRTLIPGTIAEPLQLPRAATPDDLAYVIHTSGSTGVPKGVCMPHRALVNLTRWQLRAQLGGVRTAQLSSIGFDVHFQEIFIPLASGGEVLLAPDSARKDPEELYDWLVDTGAEQLICTPTAFGGLAAAARRRGGVPSGLREVTTAGEKLHLTPDVRCFLGAASVALHNQYGPSETHAATAFPVPANHEGPPPIGRPVFGKQVHVLDGRARQRPVGVPGELYIAGEGLADGYLGMPRETAERFLPDPFSDRPGARMYRSGDVGRWRFPGVLEHRGRVDDQIKIRGVRIEPGEVETWLQRHSGVAAAAVAVREPVPGTPVLTAYVVPAAGDRPPPAEELRRHLRERLPSFAVPTRYVVLDALPKTASGKVHRAALPMPGEDRTGLGESFVEPDGPVERAIAEVWREELGLTRAGVHDDFFVSGGHSLLAARLVSRLNQVLDGTLHVRDLFARPTIAGLAAALDGTRSGPRPMMELVPGEPGAPAPLTSAEQRLWFLDHLRPGETEFLLPMVLRLEGPLDEPALRRALDALSARHDILRTRYPVGQDGAAMRVVDPIRPVPLAVENLAGTDRDERAKKIIEADLQTPFDLAAEPPLRARLLRLHDNEHLLVLVLHHIACDGRALRLIRHELLENYRAGGAGPHDRQPQYADFARWQQQHHDEAYLSSLIDHWKRVLDGYRPLDLPTDRPRPEVWSSAGGLHRFELPEDTWERVSRYASRAGATPFMVLLAAFVTVLRDLSGQGDLVVGVPVSGRGHPQTETMIGSFADTLVLRLDASGGVGFAELLGRVRENALVAFAHQDLPFDRLVRAIRPPRTTSRFPIVDVNFNFVADTEPFPTLPALTVTEEPWASTVAGKDVELILQRDYEGRLTGELEYAAALFTAGTARRMADAFLRVLDAVVPGEGTEQ